MKKKTLSRREFLKAVVAGAAAGGLSHFRVLNFGGAGVVLARECEPGSGEDPDVCDPLDGNTDWCVPAEAEGGADPDYCNPTGEGTDPDMCPDTSGAEPPDICSLAADPDYCNPEIFEADTCDLVHGEPDICIGDEEGDGDLCAPTANEADVCVPEWGEPDDGTGDECNPAAGVVDECDPVGNLTDVCNPSIGEGDVCGVGDNYEKDVCIGDSNGDGDLCYSDGTYSDPDICAPPNESDTCSAGPEDDDVPNPVTLTSLTGTTSVLPALGAAAAGLGWAALHSARREEDEEEDAPLED